MKALFLFIALTGLSHHLIGQADTRPNDIVRQLVLDNENVKVYAYEAKPGKDVCGLGKHSHPAHLTVMLTDANVTVTNARGEVKSAKMTAGTSFWSEAETHTVINSGLGPVKCQIVEIKKTKS